MPVRNASTSRFPSERCWKVWKSWQNKGIPSFFSLFTSLVTIFTWAWVNLHKKSSVILKCMFSLCWRALFIIRWFSTIRFFADSVPWITSSLSFRPLFFFFALFGSSQVVITAVIFLAKLLVLNGWCVNPVRISVKIKAFIVLQNSL